MRRFTQLFEELDRTTRTSERVAALKRYFSEAPPADAAWALYFLNGRRVKGSVSGPKLRDWLAEESALPGWLVSECHEATGDLADLIANLLPLNEPGTDEPLHRVVQDRILPLPKMTEQGKRELVTRTWREFSSSQRLVWHKLIGGEFRIGVSAKLVSNALAEVAKVEPAVMAHRLMGRWSPREEDFARIVSGDGAQELGQPYPFYLASPLEGRAEELGAIDEWQAEWKWDGIRAQMIHRRGEVLIWSRGEELMSDRFPELAAAARALPEGTVVDGEILAWDNGRPLGFALLQRRIGRKREEARLFDEVPLAFLAYDLLELGGVDIRGRPLSDRRGELERIIPPMEASEPVRLSPIISAVSWEELEARQKEAREKGVEGIMLKRKASPYGVGRQRGDWWKWKVDPFTIDAVMIYAQAGHGRRASLFTDYTFGLWSDGELVPVAKAYSGLTDEEIREVDAFVRKNTLESTAPCAS